MADNYDLSFTVRSQRIYSNHEMEPMTLGSPVGSPSTQNPTSPFLPGYLMGDPVPQPTSPSKTPRHVHFAPSFTSPMPTPSSTVISGTAALNDSLSRFHKSQREKSGGPPTVGLFDTLEVNTSALTSTPPLNTSTFQSPGPSHQSQPLTTSATPTRGGSISADDADRWVTVFGFPPAAASAVLAQFSQLGHIVEHRFPGQGNWVNLCYQTRLDARRALSYNGKVLPSHVMVGVLPCRDTVQPGSALKDMTNVLSSTATPTTPKSPQMARLSQRHFMTSPASSPYPSSPRAGRQLRIGSPTENEVIGSQNTPTKNTSFVTRAVDFVFGW